MNANGRRQRQARNGYKHIAPLRRPRYTNRSIEAQQRHEAALRETAKRIQGRKK